MIFVPFHRNLLKYIVKAARTRSGAEEEGMVVKTRVRNGASRRRRKGKEAKGRQEEKTNKKTTTGRPI